MYTFNIFIFGHNLSKNKEINNQIEELISFRKIINGKTFEISCPYHGGTLPNDIQPVIFGTTVTDDDHNPNFIQDCFKANNQIEEYKNDYAQFLQHVKNGILEDKNKGEEDYDIFADELIKFLDENEPEFYLLEASS